MSVSYSKLKQFLHKFFAAFAIIAIIATAVPPQAFASQDGGNIDTDTQENANNGGSAGVDNGGSVAQNGTTGGEGTSAGGEASTSGDTTNAEQQGNATTTTEEVVIGTASTTTEETSTTTDTGTETGNNGETTQEGGEGGTSDSQGLGMDGENGTDGGQSGDTSTTTQNTATTTQDTATSTNATSTDDVGDTGSEGNQGVSGEVGGGGATGENGGTSSGENDVESASIPVVSENEIGDDAQEGEDITGGIVQTGRNTTINTGDATAKGEVATDANSNNVRSELGTYVGDLDTYTFNATGTSEAVVSTEGVILAETGSNTALSTGAVDIKTGNAVSALNIANVINSNIVNSNGFIRLLNQVPENGQSLDLTDFFFPDPTNTFAVADTCTLLSCTSEDVIYNFSQTNTATVTNEAIIESITGDNVAEGGYTQIDTGNAYGAANVINVVNTNIIDSNYRLLTMNAIGDLDGDLVLPTEELFKAFFGRPNGLTQIEQVESTEDVAISVDNKNEAVVDNNLNTNAVTGDNTSTTYLDSSIQTGRSEAESNVLNKINTNIYGGDVMYLLIKVHGYWSGDVVGLPDGLSWAWTPDGILIYNEGAEIEPSEILPYDMDSYSANFTNKNDVVLENNININSVTGENEIDGTVGSIITGDAYASANVMNIANTNAVGVNWTFAVINIFGDFDGNVTFSQTDLELAGGVSAVDQPVGPDSLITYTYTVKNSSDAVASNVTLTQTLQSAYATGTSNEQTVSIGTLAPGEETEVTLEAFVDTNLDYGTTSVIAVATVDSDESDSDESNNSVLINVNAYRGNSDTSVGDTGTTTNDGNGTSTDNGSGDTGTTTNDGTGTSTDDGTGNTESGNNVAVTNGSQSSSGGGGGSSSSKKKNIERTQKKVDPNSAPFLLLEKESSVDTGSFISAGTEVDYTIILTNKGGTAYDATVYDTLTNPIGSVMNEQSWDLGTILPGEVIELTYTTAYNFQTPSGKYTNTASIEAYRNEDSKATGGRPLRLDDAVHTIEISGVDLAVGNVGALAYFPGPNGTVSALVAWETSKSAVSQVFFGPYGITSPYNKDAVNLGYQSASFKFSAPKIKHLMILTGLKRGVKYSYRIDADNGEFSAVSSEYSFTIPAYLASLTLALPNSPVAKVAGASISKPVPLPKPVSKPVFVAPRPYVPKVIPPTPTPIVATPTEPIPSPQVEDPKPEKQKKGGFGGFVKKVFGFFR